jgi:hypothetical protein
VAFALLLDFPVTASIGQPDSPRHAVKQQVPGTPGKKAGPAEASGEYPAIPDCTVMVVPGPVADQPALQRATFANPLPVRKHRVQRRRKASHVRHPHRAKHYHRRAKHKASHRVHRGPVRRHHIRRHTLPHRPVHPQRPIVHRVTYAVPLCGHPDKAISDLLGLPRVTQPPVAAEETANSDRLPVFIDLPPFVGGWPWPTGGGPTGPGPIVPIWPVGPGPIVLVPPGPPVVTTPVTPPPPAAVPEPSSWALMLLGMILVGGGMRRRRTAAVLQ